MSGPPPAPAPAVDHDRFFKELITTFLLEFLLLFFPKLAESLDPDSIEFLSQEHFDNLLDGDQYLADIVVKARFKGDDDAFFLIHVEHQSTAPANFPRRFFRYYSAIFEKHGVPVYPIVIYSHDACEESAAGHVPGGFPGWRGAAVSLPGGAVEPAAMAEVRELAQSRGERAYG